MWLTIGSNMADLNSSKKQNKTKTLSINLLVILLRGLHSHQNLV
jgi:hypothetical protein